MHGPEGQDWVKVVSCGWVHEAHFIVSVLESLGFEARIPDAYTLGIDPGLAPAYGGVRVLVRRSELLRATNILADLRTDTPCE